MTDPGSPSSKASPASDFRPVAQACALLSTWTGLELRGSAPRRVEEFLRMRAAHLGYASQVEYVEFLLTQKPTDGEAQRLTNLVTNGLTCFWRDTPQLNALGAVLTELRDQRSAAHPGVSTPLNVWCAGCSTGEEAYTVAMIAAEQGVPIHVLGSDINTESLRHATRGVYGEWSLRRTDSTHLQRYFEPAGEGQWAISKALSERVQFQRHNILSPAPDPPGGGKWDVILCRNVLIYFSDEAIKTVLRLFSDSVDAGGYLLLGSSEQLHTGDLADSLVPFRAARHGGGFVYRLRSTPPGQTVGFSWRHLPQDAEPSSPTLDLNHHFTLEEETSDVSVERTSNLAAERLLGTAIEHLANERTEAALACCEASASYDPFVPEIYCLMGYILHQADAFPQALATYRKALFLEPFNWIAALESARIYMRLQDASRARRLLRQTLEGLASRRPLSAGMLKLGRAMSGAITERAQAANFCAHWTDWL